MTAFLGPYDEPQGSGAVVAVNWGDYARQEIFVRSGANIGAWYCLGNEFGRPKVWIDPRPTMWTWDRSAPPPRPGPGEVPQHPHWEDVLARGGMMSDPKENFRRYVDDSANLLALDLAALLNRAHNLGVAICPDVDPSEGISYLVEWAFGASRHVDVEWDAGRNRWAVIGGVVEGMPQARSVAGNA